MIALVIVRLRAAAAVVGQGDEQRPGVVARAHMSAPSDASSRRHPSAYSGDIQPCACPARSASGQCSRIRPRRCVRSVDARGRQDARRAGAHEVQSAEPESPADARGDAAKHRRHFGHEGRRREAVLREQSGSGDQPRARFGNEQAIAGDAVAWRAQRQS